MGEREVRVPKGGLEQSKEHVGYGQWDTRPSHAG